MIRRISREMALQSLFQIDIYEGVRQSLSLESIGEIDYSDFTIESALAAAFLEHDEDKDGGKKALKAQGYAELLVRGVVEHKAEIDKKLTEYAVDWPVERMSAADRNILRIAVFEMVYADVLQEPGVAINEAVEIAKAYGTDDSPRFINGVLGKMMKK